MSYEYHITELMKAKKALETAANDAEQGGFRVTLTFQKDSVPDRHKGKPHQVAVVISKDVS